MQETCFKRMFERRKIEREIFFWLGSCQILLYAEFIHMHTFAAAKFQKQIRQQTFLLAKSVNG